MAMGEPRPPSREGGVYLFLMFTFFLGAPTLGWLEQTEVPLFLSYRKNHHLQRDYAPRCLWAVDSGGFSELNIHGKWTLSARDYASTVRRWSTWGGLLWAAIQDWMCEPEVLRKTGLSVHDHQMRTCWSYLELRSLAPDLPWAPILQGWNESEYWEHWDLYASMGVDLAALPTVGVGSVCRRKDVYGMADTLQRLAAQGLRLHAFGLKQTGIRVIHENIQSSDSMAWSIHASKRPPLKGHTHERCTGCLEYALLWRARLIEGIMRWPGLARPFDAR